jgi:hypothetical protein
MTRRETSELYRQLGLVLTPLRDTKGRQDGKDAFLPAWNTREYTDANWKEFHGQRYTNFGLVLGERSSNIICVDTDPRNGSVEWCAKYKDQLEDSCGIIEESGRGGWRETLFFHRS